MVVSIVNDLSADTGDTVVVRRVGIDDGTFLAKKRFSQWIYSRNGGKSQGFNGRHGKKETESKVESEKTRSASRRC